MIVRFRQIRAPRLAFDIGYMPNRMSHLERVSFSAVDAGSFFIVLPRGIELMQISLDRTHSCESLRELTEVAGLPPEAHRLNQIPFRVFKPILSSRLKCLPQKFGCQFCHSAC